MVLEDMSGLMEKFIKEIGKMEKWKEMDSFIGKNKGNSMKGSMTMI